MDNQHRMIAGYRDLSQGEIDLMNEIKAVEAQVADLHMKIADLVHGPGDAGRQAALARTDFEAGFMRLLRAVAQPHSPWSMPRG